MHHVQDAFSSVRPSPPTFWKRRHKRPAVDCITSRPIDLQQKWSGDDGSRQAGKATLSVEIRRPSRWMRVGARCASRKRRCEKIDLQRGTGWGA